MYHGQSPIIRVGAAITSDYGRVAVQELPMYGRNEAERMAA
jgi:hypothetical protein